MNSIHSTSYHSCNQCMPHPSRFMTTYYILFTQAKMIHVWVLLMLCLNMYDADIMYINTKIVSDFNHSVGTYLQLSQYDT